MKEFKVRRSTLIDNNWQELFHCLGRDTQVISNFLRGARKAYNLPANDLDSILADIGNQVEEYVTVNSSGSIHLS